MSKTNELADRTLTITKTFKAPIKLVWEAWTQPEHIANWWGPNGMKTKIIKHEFKVGGEWKYTMTMPNGGEFISEGVYAVIETLKEIYTSAEFKPMTEGVELQCLFEDGGDNTHFTFNCIHPTAAYCKQQEEMGFYKGWGSVFTGLATYLESKA